MRREGVRRDTLDYPTSSLIFVVGTEAYLQPADSCLMTLNRALVCDQNYEFGGREFESLRARQFARYPVRIARHSHGNSFVRHSNTERLTVTAFETYICQFESSMRW